jgi:superfamily II DNA or RNA helicase
MSIDSILDALDRACSETSFDESGDIDSNYDIDCGQGGDELVEGQASQSINRVEVRGKNYTKNRLNRRRRALKKGLEEGFERVEKFFGKKLYPEQRLVLAHLYQNKDVILRARTGFGKSMLFFGFVLMMPANASRFITIILTPLQALGHRHSAELNELCKKRYEEDKAKQEKRAAEKKTQRDARGAATSSRTIVSTPASSNKASSDSTLRRDNDGSKKAKCFE